MRRPRPDAPAGKLAIVLSYSGDGGVERMMNSLIAGLIDAGFDVDVLVLRTEGSHFAHMPSAARVIPLGTSHASLAVPALARYLRRERPAALLAAKDRAGRAALRARRLSGVETRVVLRVGNTLSQSLARHGRVKRWLRLRPIRRLYPQADAIVAVSKGVADDIIALTAMAPERVRVIANPVIAPDMADRAATRPDHAWLRDGEPPLILGVGRLQRQKDFPTLVRAFADLRRQMPARLVILGEGSERAALLQLAQELGVDADFDLPGFSDRAHAWMAAADLFVLSSAWEGSPNALTEAMALGTPVVATDCPSGPRELLGGGRVAPLVPVGDAKAMAEAMARMLRDPPAAATLRAAVADHTRAASTARYVEALSPGDACGQGTGRPESC